MSDNINYKIQKGDTLTSISQKTGIDLNVLKSAENLDDPSVIREGYLLIIRNNNVIYSKDNASAYNDKLIINNVSSEEVSNSTKEETKGQNSNYTSTNAAGQVCEPCENSRIKDSCVSWVDITIHDPDKKEPITDKICGGQQKKYYITDKAYGVTLLPLPSPISPNELVFNSKREKGINSFKIESKPAKAKTIDINIHGKCSIDDKNCPKGRFFKLGDEKSILIDRDKKGINLLYDPTSLIDVILDPAEWGRMLVKRILPGIETIIKGNVQYNLVIAKTHPKPDGQFIYENARLFIDRAFGRHIPARIYIFPYLEGTFGIGFGKNKIVLDAKMTDNQRKMVARVQNTGKDVIRGSSKQIRKSQKGWEEIPSEIKTSTSEFRFNGSFTIGKNRFEYERTNVHSYLSETAKKLEDLNLLSRVTKMVSTPSSKGSKSGPIKEKPIFSFEFERPNINMLVKFKYENSDNFQSTGIDWEAAIAARPLVGGTIKIDLLQVFAAYFKLEKLIEKLRVALEKGLNGNSLHLKCEFSLRGALEFGSKIEKKHSQDWDYNLDETGISITPGFILDVRGEVNAWLASGAFALTGTFSCEFRVDIRLNGNKDAEVVGYHKGAWLEFEARSKGGLGNSNDLSSLEDEKPDVSGKWLLYDEIPEDKAMIFATFK